MTTTQIIEALTHTTDGPVSQFTILHRAIAIAARHPELASAVTEAAADELALSSETLYASQEE